MNGLTTYGITNFTLEEMVPPEVFNNYSPQRVIQFLDMRVWRAVQWIRSERGNAIYVNTWGINRPDWYPEFTGRGLRIPAGPGLVTSQHFYGRAADIDEVGIDNKELYQFCLDNQGKLLEFGITTIEHLDDTPTWIHLDCRNWFTDITAIQIVRG